MKWQALGVIAFVVLSTSAASAADDAAAFKAKLMASTKVVAVMGASADFVPDNDPDTLQVIFMPDAKRASHVTGDGEAIFLTPDVADSEETALIGQAFDLRVQRRLKAAD